MTDAENDFAQSLRLSPKTGRLEPDFHPTPEELAAYHEDRLPPTRENAVREHLIRCSECAALVLDLAELKDPEPLPAPAAELGTAWQKQRAQLQERGLLPNPADSTPAAAPRKTSLWGLRRVWTLAAVLSLTSLFLSVWVVTLEQSLRKVREPQVNPPVINLEPIGDVRSATVPPVPRLHLEPGQRAWLIFNLAGRPPELTFRAEFRDAADQVRWIRTGLRPSEAGNFRCELADDTLPPGRYRVLLWDGQGEPPERIAEYAFEVVPGAR